VSEAGGNGSHEDLDAKVWSGGGFVRGYANRQLRPAEVVLLVRHREALSGRVLELGPGAGRVTGYLVDIAREVEAVELSADMVAYCRRTFPTATFHQGDMTDLSRFDDGSFDAVVAPYNVIDVLTDERRRALLDGVARVVGAEGVFIFSTHNRGHADRLQRPTSVRTSDPLRLVFDVVKMPVRVRNRRRLAPRQEQHRDYAILNDNAHDFSLLHYYIDRDAQERQLAEHGWALVECVDLDGHAVGPGDAAEDTPELHYVARRAR
jgi:SAM-dependent methyltransferase